MFERRSKFRVARVSLEPQYVAAYFGVDGSDVEDTTQINPTCSTTQPSEKTMSERQTDSTSVPSFHCTLPSSPFESTYYESFSQTRCKSSASTFTPHHTKQPTDNVDRRTMNTLNRTSGAFTIVPSFHCDIPRSPFQSTYAESVMEGASNQAGGSQSTLTASQVNEGVATQRTSRSLTSVVPSFNCQVPYSPFCSTYAESQPGSQVQLAADVDMEADDEEKTPTKSTEINDVKVNVMRLLNTKYNMTRRVTEPVQPYISEQPSITNKSTDEVVEKMRKSVGASRFSVGSAWQSLAGSTLVSDSELFGFPDSPRRSQNLENLDMRPFRRATMDAMKIYEPIDELTENTTAGQVPQQSHHLTQHQTLEEEVSNRRCSSAMDYSIQKVTLNNFTVEPHETVEAFHQSLTFGPTDGIVPAAEDSAATQDVPPAQRNMPKKLPRFSTLNLFGARRSVISQRVIEESTIDDSNSTYSSSKRSSTPSLPNIPYLVPKPASVGRLGKVQALAQHFDESSESVAEPVEQSVDVSSESDKIKVDEDKTLKSAVKRPQEFPRKSIALREIVYNYATPPSAARVSRRKSVSFKPSDSTGLSSPSATDLPSSPGVGLYARSGVPRVPLSPIGCSDDDTSSPSAKQILLRRTSALSKRSSLSTSQTNAKNKSNSVMTSSPLVISRGSVPQEEVVGCLDDGSFTTIQSRDSFFSQISDLSPIKSVPSRRSAFSSSHGQDPSSTVSSSPSIRQKNATNSSPFLPRGNWEKSLDDICGSGIYSDIDIVVHDLSQEVEAMDLDDDGAENSAPIEPPSTPRSRRSGIKLLDNSIFTTGANESSLHINAPIIDDSDSYGINDETGAGDATENVDPDCTTGSTITFAARRQSCASCGPSRTHIVLNCAPAVQESPLYVLPAPKIVHSKNDDDETQDGVRRSKRNRLPRLNAIQKPVYERDADGNYNLVGVSDVIVRDKLLKKHHVTDPVVAMEKEQEMKRRKRLEQEKRKKSKTIRQ